MTDKLKTTLSIIGVLLIIALLLYFGYSLGKWKYNNLETVIEYDTVVIEKPTVVREYITKVVEVPVEVQVPTTTQTEPLPEPPKKDSTVTVKVNIIEREYRDSTYHAIVSGPQIGSHSPTLSFIETYNTTVTQSTLIKPNPIRPFLKGGTMLNKTNYGIKAGAGLLIKDKWAPSVSYIRLNKESFVEVELGYVF